MTLRINKCFFSALKLKKNTLKKTDHNGDSVSSVRVTGDEPVTKELATISLLSHHSANTSL